MFKRLKDLFVKALIRRTLDLEKEYTVETDASDFAMGAVLRQDDDQGKKHPVMFWSRKFGPAELNYDTHDKEMLAIVAAFKEWRVYLQGAKH